MLRAERQSARMSKITNDGLTRSAATVGVKGLTYSAEISLVVC